MAELALAAPGPVVAALAKKLASGLWKELQLARRVRIDIEKLKSKLSMIQDVLDDAERKSITSKALQGWLRKLRDVALDAEDVVEEFETEALRRRMERNDHRVGKVREFFSSNNPIAFRREMAGKIKEIRKRFDEIAEERLKFHLAEGSVSENTLDRETFSCVIESDIYGRDDDKKEVIEFLVNKDNDKNISIFPIVGLGGVGKTTLAQLVYNDERIKERFELRMWVCVGEIFDIKMVMQKMIEQVKEGPKNFSSLETLSSLLQEQLNAKRFLLVLDDFWNEDESRWDKLKSLFVHAKLGSKIVITTRSEIVASITGTISPYRLQGLQIDDCWALFKQKAFGLGRQEETPMLVAIGKEIVKKCGGSPLAAKFLGSLMGSKRGEEAWLAIKDNDIWKLSVDKIEILSILKLSYDHLPFYLKRCFTYCAVFPKDHQFQIKRLIQLWMAEGLIDTSDASQNAEDIGKQYFNNLLWRSFFQDVRMDKYDNTNTCKMHDLVHDLACSITKDETLVMEGDTKSISHGCRYLYTHASSIDLKTTYEAKKMRSLILVEAQYHYIVDVDEFIFNVTTTFTQLRALDLRFGRIQKLSGTISKLKHLRFLDLSYTGITALPISITGLYNLQTLNLSVCRTLQELPEGIGNLCNLRYMDISRCTKITTLPTSITKLYNLQTLNLQECYHLQELPEGISNLRNLRHMDISHCHNLSCMPPNLGRLSNLETLPMFIVAKENGRTIVELRHLNYIRNELVIKNLRHVKDPNEAMQANLSEKTRLNWLILEWNEGLNEEQEPSSTEVDVAAGVLEKLQPHHNLLKLEISYYIGTRLPDWMSSSFLNLVELTLGSLKRCEHLPPLGQLPLLKNLTVFRMHAVMRIGKEFYGDGDGNAFPSLEEMNLWSMLNLEEWHTEPTTAGRKMTAFPRLTKLCIRLCPKLTVLPSIPCYAEILDIAYSNEMLLSAASLAGLSKLKRFMIWGCRVSSSSSSGWWDGLQYLTFLKELQIWNCPELTCLPEGTMYLPSLHTLDLNGNKNLRSIEGGGRKQQQPTPFFTALQRLYIRNCPQLVMLPDGLQHLTDGLNT